MHDYLIVPKAPLMLRDGRNFGAEAGLADTLPFPRPSTLAGAMRTAWAESQPDFSYNEDGKIQLLAHQVQGPLLAEINAGQLQILLPAPADAVCLSPINYKPTPTPTLSVFRLKPEALVHDKEGTDLPHSGLMPVFLQGDNNSKPISNPPAFWYFERMTTWLEDDTSLPQPLDQQGVSALPKAIRTHVAIDSQTQTNKIAHLFQTAGLHFAERRLPKQNSTSWGWAQPHYGLLMRFSADMPDSYRTVGGEARLSQILNRQGTWPQCPDSLANALANCQGFRLILVTPALFEHGYLPGFIDPETLSGQIGGLSVGLKAISMPRWQAGTSWDMQKSWDSKTRIGGRGMRTAQRMVPAGAVFWFEIIQGDSAALKNLWLHPITDRRANDGYGLAIPGVWTP
ncbi:MAG: hypothetical protein CTY34_08770 [Methylobacter sp.]|nr:MAG: hypothetical protein CTY34_08770 [Methylobacter sp.]PPD18700.1 MAG: hypothetical protein CTY24_12540 [Methylobacter sp.]PPD32294.1 MAG: hypothetical protein CTY18_10780 [Methylomonas sp.]